MPSYSCTPQLIVVDINDDAPAVHVTILGYSTATMFHGHFSCTAD